MINAIPSNKTTSSTHRLHHSLSRVNTGRSRDSTFEKSGVHLQGTIATTIQGDTGNEQLVIAVEEETAPPAHAPFFSSYYNRLDGIVVLSYWVDFAFMMVGIQDVYIFKAISALRPLRLLTLTEGTSVGFLTQSDFGFKRLIACIPGTFNNCDSENNDRPLLTRSQCRHHCFSRFLDSSFSSS